MHGCQIRSQYDHGSDVHVFRGDSHLRCVEQLKERSSLSNFAIELLDILLDHQRVRDATTRDALH